MKFSARKNLFRVNKNLNLFCVFITNTYTKINNPLGARAHTRAPKEISFYFIYIITLVILTTPLCYLTQNGLL